MIRAREAIEAINRHRDNAVVVSTMTAMQLWDRTSQRPELDLPILGCMGKASSVALGLALARPDRKVVTLDGDGCLIMNLGSMITIANKKPRNFVLIVFQDDSYFTTGGQPTPGSENVSFATMAKGAGFVSTYDFTDLEEFVNLLPNIMRSPGPILACLHVEFDEHMTSDRINTKKAIRAVVDAIS